MKSLSGYSAEVHRVGNALPKPGQMVPAVQVEQSGASNCWIKAAPTYGIVNSLTRPSDDQAKGLGFTTFWCLKTPESSLGRALGQHGASIS